MKRGKDMFYEPKTLIIVYKDEMLANQMKKMIETKDDTEESNVIGTTDNSINVISWTEKIWIANKKAGNITSKILFLGDIKGVDALIPVIDIKFNKHGVRYGWAGNQAVIYASLNEIKSIENFRAFHDELEALPAPKVIKEAIKPRTIIEVEPKSNTDTLTETEPAKQEKENFFAKGKSIAIKVKENIDDTFADISKKAIVFSEENFRNKKAMERQMLFFGVISMYNEGLETFMKS